MVKLRSLIVVTGSVHVEGGETNIVKNRRAQRTTATITVRREVDPARRAANVISADYTRRLRRLPGFILRTPYGVLVDPKEGAPAVRELLVDIDKKIAARNGSACTVSNCVLLERLNGDRQERIEEWIGQRLGDKTVKEALPKLTA